MKPIRIVVLAVAAVAAIGLAVLVRGAMSGKPTSQAEAAIPVAPPKPMARVLVAGRDLKVGERLSPEDLTWQEWPAETVNPLFFTDGGVAVPVAAPVDPCSEEERKAAKERLAKRTKMMDREQRRVLQAEDKAQDKACKEAAKGKKGKKDKPDATQTAIAGATATVTRAVAELSDGGPKAQFVGSVVREAFLKGEPIVDRKLVRAGESGYLAVVLSPGMRAMAVSVKVETAAGGFILPGDRVDVILSRELQGEQRNVFVSETVLRNVRVLAIDQVTQPDKNETTVVGATATLELGSTAAEALALAKAQGDISLTLRSYADVGEASGVVSRQAYGGPASAQTGAYSSVRVFRNGEATAVSVP